MVQSLAETPDGIVLRRDIVSPCIDAGWLRGDMRALVTCSWRVWCRVLLVVECALLLSGQAAFARQRLSPAEELATRFAPVIMLQQQAGPCDEEGEPFLPAPVDVVFNDNTVILREGEDQHPVLSPVTNAALAAGASDWAIDLPGKPREPGCDYETHFKEVMGDQKPVIYAHIAQEEGRPGIALQFWFFYYYNQFNNLHEGDWEMIQLLFDADSIEGALAQDPVEVAYAQHEGGETSLWNAPKLEREGTRPVVYASRGSHASYYGPGLWLGWGQDNSGLGCDIANGELVRIDPEVRLIPETITGPEDPFAWSTFAGRWGERDSSFYNGPTGPAFKSRWTEPITWMEGLRTDSIRVNASTLIGPAPSDIFCNGVGFGSMLFTLFKPYPWLVVAIMAAGVVLIVVALRVTKPVLRDTWTIYRPHFRTFATIGGITVPITLTVSLIQYLLATSPGFAALTGWSEDGPIQEWLDLASLIQQGLLLLLVIPTVVLVTAAAVDGKTMSASRAFQASRRRVFDLIRTLLRGFLIVTGLTLTVVGIPWAINRSVRWMFGPQATMLEAQRGKTALATSSEAVRGHWWQAALSGATLGFIGGAPGVIVGLLLFILVRLPVDVANSISTLVYAVVVPFAIAGLTILFLTWRGSKGISRDHESAESSRR
ncbi:MAG: Vps62-related protein [Thermomicrobiales bacterium]